MTAPAPEPRADSQPASTASAPPLSPAAAAALNAPWEVTEKLAAPPGEPATFSAGDLDAWAASSLDGPPPPGAAPAPDAAPPGDAPLSADVGAAPAPDAAPPVPSESGASPSGAPVPAIEEPIPPSAIAAARAPPAHEAPPAADPTSWASEVEASAAASEPSSPGPAENGESQAETVAGAPERASPEPTSTPAEPAPPSPPPSAAPAPPDGAAEAQAPTQPPGSVEEGVELPAASGDLQLTDTWDFVSWQAESAPGTTVDLPGAAQGDPPDLQLAEAWEYARWARTEDSPETPSAPDTAPAPQPDGPPPPAPPERAPAETPAPPEQASSPPPEKEEEAPREAVAPEPLDAPGDPPGTPPPEAPDAAGPVEPGAIRELLDAADRDVAVGKALLRYSEGRFSRAFLFVEQLDTVMVWRGTGEGSDDPALAALRVDLEEPSVLRRAMEQKAPVHFDVPESPLDEALYVALSPRSPYLVIAPIFAAGRAVSFLYAESALEPFSPEAEAELAEVVGHASHAYERIRAR